MFTSLRFAWKKAVRDRDLPATALLRKATRYATELATARLFLRGVDHVGEGVRTLGRPHIENLGRMEIGDGTLLRSINVPVELTTGVGAVLTIGVDVRLNYGVSIGVRQSIVLGDRVRCGPYVMIIDTEFHDPYNREQLAEPRPVLIEDDVFIGAKASIMPGVTIGRGAIVGTSAVVTRDVAPFTVVGGVPAKKLRSLDPARFRDPEG